MKCVSIKIFKLINLTIQTKFIIFFVLKIDLFSNLFVKSNY